MDEETAAETSDGDAPEAAEPAHVAERPRTYDATRKTVVSDMDDAQLLEQLRKEMSEAASNLEFEKAARLRDRIFDVQKRKTD